MRSAAIPAGKGRDIGDPVLIVASRDTVLGDFMLD